MSDYQLGGFPTRALAGMGETFNRRAGDLLEPLVEALTGPMTFTDDLLVDVDPVGHPRVVDLPTTPFPGWLGQVCGIPVPPGLSADQQRAYVRDAPYRRRGTVRAMAQAVQAVLGGDKHVEILERLAGNAYRIAVKIYGPDTPGITAADVVAAAAAQKPVGLVIDHVEIVAADTDEAYLFARWYDPENVRYARMSANHPTYPEWATAYPTYSDARDADRTDEES